MTEEELKAVPRSEANCAFYPGYFWAGDCDHEDWRNGTCGLPADVKAQVHAERRAAAALRSARWQLGERLKSEAHRGLHDDKLEPSS